MRKVLVTGGAGFLGSHLCDRLLGRGDEVVCLDNFSTGSRQNIAHLMKNRAFDLMVHDVIDETPMMQVDEIFHLACPASPIQYQKNPVGTIRTAVHGTLNLLNMAREIGARILIASTSEVYGDPLAHPQEESYWGNVNPIGPRACYDEGKRCAEALTVSYARQFGVETRVARIFNTYGSRMHPDDGRVVSNFVVQALRGRPLTVYGDGKQTRSFCYVSDLVDGLLRLCACACDPGPVNLGHPDEHTMLDLAKRTIDLVCSKSEIVFCPLPVDDPSRRRPDIARAMEILRWSPRVGIDEGLAHTVDYFRELLAS